MLSPAAEALFWQSVDKSADCWTWTGRTWRTGYGYVRIGGKPLLAHRVAWELTNGPIPEGMFLCHRCDNRLCIRPDHIFLGTAAENNRDRTAKGRAASGVRNGAHTHPERRPRGDRNGRRTKPDAGPRGERHGQARLTMAQVHQIRDRYIKRKVAQHMLAKEFGVSQATVWRIVANKNWKIDSPEVLAVVAPEPADQKLPF